MSTEAILRRIRDEAIRFVDVRFTDLRGALHHVTLAADHVDAALIEEGCMFDGSSIAGWKSVEASDMKLRPDPQHAYIDPFHAEKTLCLHCSVVEPDSGEAYVRDPRSIAARAEAHLNRISVADAAYFGPEAEFFIFDDVRIATTMNRVAHEVDAPSAAWNSDTAYAAGNKGHRPHVRGGYLPVGPMDDGQDLRSEMLTTMQAMGMQVDKHHHEAATCQHELGLVFGPLLRQADEMQKYKYVVRNVAAAYGRTATFMPKPLQGDNGSGMHVNLSLWKDGHPLFAGDGYGGLSDTALWFVGGILRHARALNAFTNPTTNSYKRLVPGFAAPVLQSWSAHNRSGCVRIPWARSARARRIEARFPDPSANPYLAFSALLMAGLDGIERRIDPGDAMETNLYDIPSERPGEFPMLCRSLREALDALEEDHDFLRVDDVFPAELIESYIALKWTEVTRYDTTPHPVEFAMYYSI